MIVQNHRLVLGTAQLGMSYGIANTTGQPDLKTAENIICTALDNGIREFDTAQAYGTSEMILGSILKHLGVSEKVNIISKLHPDFDWQDRQVLDQALHESLINLGIRRLHGLMLHREELLDAWDQGLGEILSEFVNKGWVKKLGVSVYSPIRAKQALAIEKLDMIQMPSNLLDHRFEKEGIFQLAQKMGKKIYVRSIFLQGLLLSATTDLKGSILCALPVLEKLNRMAKEWGISCHEMSLGYVKEAYPDARIVFGAETPEQVAMNVSVWNSFFPPERLREIRDTFSNVNEDILNPANWST